MRTATIERPIIMGPGSVRAILEGRKTQTRRVVRPQPPEGHDRHCWFDAPVYGWTTEPEPAAAWHKVRCPYGVPGERLWVREGHVPLFTPGGMARYALFRDGSHKFETGHYEPGLPVQSYAPGAFDGYTWRPSIHLARWASRLILEITGVRVGRLQEISDDDAIRELGAWRFGGEDEPSDRTVTANDPVGEFARHWDAISARRGHSWESNPWVWAISFRRVDPE